MAAHIVEGSDGHYLLATCRELSHIAFDISHSFMLSCAAKDSQSSAGSARLLSTALLEAGLVQRPQMRLTVDDCSPEAVGSVFKSQARRVGENGLFVFAYHGPAVPAGTLLSWLHSLQPPRHIIFFLDFPSATQVAKLITSPVSLMDGVEKLCVFCAGAHPLTSQLARPPLAHSLFSHFTATAITSCTPSPTHPSHRIIYISDISRCLRECSTAMTSLCLPEAQQLCRGPEAQQLCRGPEVVSVQTQPLILLQRHHDQRFGTVGEDTIDGVDETDGEGEEETDGCVARFSFLEKFYKRSWRKEQPKLCDLAHGWLADLKHSSNSPLLVLYRHGLLSTGEMLSALLRLLVFSLAVLQESGRPGSSADPNTLIVVYLQAAGLLEHISSSEIAATAGQFQAQCEAYCLALQQTGVNTAQIRKMAKKVEKDIK